MIAWILIVTVATGAPDGGVPARDKLAVRRAKLTPLLSRDPVPTASDVRALDAEPSTALGAIVADKSAPTRVRSRAIDLWAEISPGEVDLAAVIADRAEEDGLRVTAAKALLRARGADAVNGARPLLDDPKAPLRTAAAEALGRLAIPEAREALRQRLDAETDVGVRAALERALARGTP